MAASGLSVTFDLPVKLQYEKRIAHSISCFVYKKRMDEKDSLWVKAIVNLANLGKDIDIQDTKRKHNSKMSGKIATFMRPSPASTCCIFGNNLQRWIETLHTTV